MIHPIRYYGDPVLRQAAKPVTSFDPELGELVKDMFETMYDANGIGLAAPQIGIPMRLFVALELGPPPENEDESEDLDDLTPEQKRSRWGVVGEHAMVNPDICHREGLQTGQDGCLSVPGLYIDELERDARITVRYQDLEGGERQLEAEGRFAHVLQHELDHLDGILFFDRLPAEERRAFMSQHRAELAEIQREAKALLKSLRQSKRTPVGG